MARPTIEITPWDPSVGSGLSNSGKLSNKYLINGTPVVDIFSIPSSANDTISTTYFKDATYHGTGTPLKGVKGTAATGININEYFTTTSRAAQGPIYWTTIDGANMYATFDNTVLTVSGDNYAEIRWSYGNTYNVYLNGSLTHTFTTTKTRALVELVGAGGGGGCGVNWWFHYGTGGGGGSGAYVAAAINLKILKENSNWKYIFIPGIGGEGGTINPAAAYGLGYTGKDGEPSRVLLATSSSATSGSSVVIAAGGQGGAGAAADPDYDYAYCGPGGAGGSINSCYIGQYANALYGFWFPVIGYVTNDPGNIRDARISGQHGADGGDNAWDWENNKKSKGQVGGGYEWPIQVVPYNPDIDSEATRLDIGDMPTGTRGCGGSSVLGQGGRFIAYDCGGAGAGYGAGGGGGDAGSDGQGKHGGKGADGYIAVYY